MSLVFKIEELVRRVEKKYRLLLFLALLFILLLLTIFFTRGLETILYGKMMDNMYWEMAMVEQSTLLKKMKMAKPFPKKEMVEFDSRARSAMMLLPKGKSDKVLFENSSNQSVPIASLTKMMTALVILDDYQMNRIVSFSENAANKEGEANFFHEGEEFVVKDLLASMMIESSNRAATALAEVIGEQEFIRRMNTRAEELGMSGTRFFNPTGLDPDYEHERANYSTAADIVLLTQELMKREEAVDIFRMSKKGIYDIEGNYHHTADSTNKLLGEIKSVYVAKTGTTPMAGSCFVIAFKNYKNGDILISVVLGAEDSFYETRRMLDWAYNSYIW